MCRRDFVVSGLDDEMSARLLTTIAGWCVGTVLAVYVTVPLIAEVIHSVDDVYSHPVGAISTCLDDGSTVVQSHATKLRSFIVSQEEPGYVRVTYRIDGMPFGLVHPLVAPDRNIVPTRPIYHPGDSFVIGPFIFPPLPRRADNVSVSVILPGERFGFFNTRAVIGPMRTPNCADRLPPP